MNERNTGSYNDDGQTTDEYKQQQAYLQERYDEHWIQNQRKYDLEYHKHYTSHEPRNNE